MIRTRRARVGAGPRLATAAAMPVTDEDLLGQVARGDREAFAGLYDRFSPAVFGLARRVLRNPAHAEEVAQDVLVEVWRTASRYEPERGSARTWILTMAHRRAVDRVRSEEASRRRDDRSARLEPATGREAAEEALDDLERERVSHALSGLTELQREAVVLTYYGGRTHTEVARLLEVPLGTVKTRIRDGLIRLRDNLGVTA